MTASFRDATPASFAQVFSTPPPEPQWQRLWPPATDTPQLLSLGGAQKPCISLNRVFWSRVPFLRRPCCLLVTYTSPRGELVAGHGCGQARPSSGFKHCFAQQGTPWRTRSGLLLWASVVTFN